MIFACAQWAFITDSWFRTTVWLTVWSLFGIFGYASNFGVLVGFINCLWTTPLFAVCIFIGEHSELPVLSFGSDVIREQAEKFSFNHGRGATTSKVQPETPTRSVNDVDYLAQRGNIIGL